MAKSSTTTAIKKTTKKASKRASSKSSVKQSKIKSKATTKKAKKDKKSKNLPRTNSSSKKVFAQLKNWNKWLFLIHGAQAGAIAYLASDFKTPVTAEYLTFNESTNELANASRVVADVPLAWLIIAFLALSSLAHLIIAGPWFKNYTKDLTNGINKARWIEYSLSASIMIVAIGFLSGITSIGLSLAIFGLTAVMNLLGLMMEVHNQGKDKVSWLSFWIGTLAGIIPWLIIGLGFVANWAYGNGTPPTFVYVIYGTIFAFFSSFAVNMYLQYKGRGKWSDYIYGEKAYMILSLVAKSALAWQVFAGTLRP